jgi:hypothetical protein
MVIDAGFENVTAVPHGVGVGPAPYTAVIVWLPFIVIVMEVLVVKSAPSLCHFVKLFPGTLGGAVSVTEVFGAYLRTN